MPRPRGTLVVTFPLNPYRHNPAGEIVESIEKADEEVMERPLYVEDDGLDEMSWVESLFGKEEDGVMGGKKPPTFGCWYFDKDLAEHRAEVAEYMGRGPSVQDVMARTSPIIHFG